MQLYLAASLLSPDPGLAFWFLITFVIFMWLLRSKAWGPITAALEEREQRIDESIKSADRALAEAKQIQADNMKARREAEQQAQTILREARESAEKIRTAELEKTKDSIQHLQENAKQEIEREKQKAMTDLRSQVAELAIGAAQKILAENLDKERQGKLVDSFINELRKN
ncbi:MAG: F0F1 ATP synthase subunit B [Bacteroidetes bacterium]|nr:F0F1 ATP synthase subunit B [Bacteroidota bacterium]